MSIPIRKAILVLLAPVAVLIAMNFFPASVSWTIHQRFNLNEEYNIPTWYSASLLFLVAVLSFTAYLWRNRSSQTENFWLILAVVYCYLSMDESAGIHEAIAPHVKWYYIYAPVAAAFLAYTAYHLIRREERLVCNWLLGGMLMYGTGALLLEILWYLLKPVPDWILQMFIVAEEGFEMAGTVLVIAGCLHELNRLWGNRPISRQRWSKRIQSDPSDEPVSDVSSLP